MDKTPVELAHALGMSWREITDRYGPRADMSEWDVDPFWQILLDYVNERLGGLMAVHDELSRKMRLDRKMQAYRDKAIRTR